MTVLTRHARKDGRSVAILRVLDRGGSCVVEADVFPQGAHLEDAIRPGPYTFPTAALATQFVTQAVEALTVLGCEVDEA